jgi:predicted transcriptional regulator
MVTLFALEQIGAVPAALSDELCYAAHHLSSCKVEVMPAVSVRLPEHLESLLDQEAQIAGRARSDIIREALTEYIRHQQHRRFMGAYVGEARAGYADPALLAEVRELADDALALDEEGVARLEAAGSDADEPWWR